MNTQSDKIINFVVFEEEMSSGINEHMFSFSVNKKSYFVQPCLHFFKESSNDYHGFIKINGGELLGLLIILRVFL